MEQKLPKAGRPRGFDEAVTREAIQKVFWRQGFAATSLDDLSVATGLHKPSLYGAFGNKQAMFTESFRGYLREMGQAFTGALAKPDLRDALETHFTSATEIFTRDRAARGCFMSSAAIPLAGTDGVVAERIRKSMAALEEGFRQRLTQGEADGQLSPAFDPQAGADMMLGTHLRLSTLARSGETKANLEAVWRRAVELVTRTG